MTVSVASSQTSDQTRSAFMVFIPWHKIIYLYSPGYCLTDYKLDAHIGHADVSEKQEGPWYV